LVGIYVPPMHATCPHHVSGTLTGVSMQADHSRFTSAVARVFGHITFIVSCAVYRPFCCSIVHSHRVLHKLGWLDPITKPHMSLYQIKHPVLVLTPVYASVRLPYCTRQKRCLLAKASGTDRRCGRVCSLWQDPLTECTLLQDVSLEQTALRRADDTVAA
jgi:hypothetical protein